MPFTSVKLIKLRERPAFQLLPALATLVLAGATAWLGFWQSGRALAKEAIELRHDERREAAKIEITGADVDAAAVDGRLVVARGEFLADATVYWDNQFAGRVAGFAVVTPLRLSGGENVLLVNRGVVIPGADRTQLPPLATPAGMVTVHGRAYIAPRRTVELAGNTDTKHLWQNLTPEKFAKRSKLNVHGFLLREAPDDATTASKATGALLREPDIRRPFDSGMNAAKHRGYAFQWFSLSLLVCVLFVFFTFFHYAKPPRHT